MERLEAHPLRDHPDRDRILGDHRTRERVATELDETRARIDARGSSLLRRLDAIADVLAGYEHMENPADGEWRLTPSGDRLRRIYHECDLLISIAVGGGLLDGLDPAEVAAVVSCVTYEHRSADPPPPPQFPTRTVRARFERLESLCGRLNAAERSARVPETRAPEPGFAASAWAWASGLDLVDVLDEDHTGGDFVRNVKQLIDLLRQLAELAPSTGERRACARAADALLRGVVDAGRDITEPDAIEPGATEPTGTGP